LSEKRNRRFLPPGERKNRRGRKGALVLGIGSEKTLPSFQLEKSQGWGSASRVRGKERGGFWATPRDSRKEGGYSGSHEKGITKWRLGKTTPAKKIAIVGKLQQTIKGEKATSISRAERGRRKGVNPTKDPIWEKGRCSKLEQAEGKLL